MGAEKICSHDQVVSFFSKWNKFQTEKFGDCFNTDTHIRQTISNTTSDLQMEGDFLMVAQSLHGYVTISQQVADFFYEDCLGNPPQ